MEATLRAQTLDPLVSVRRPPRPAKLVDVIARYTTPEMAELFSDRSRVQRWLDVELLAVDARAALGHLPAEEAAQIRAQAPDVDDVLLSDIDVRERVTHHDVAAFVDVVAERLGQSGRWFHFGLTSSDVVDTALAVALGAAGDLIADASGDLYEKLAAEARVYRDTVLVGRTHGVHAQPISLGSKLALLALQVERSLHRLRSATDAIRVGKLSGAVGTYPQNDPQVEDYVCEALGLTPVPASQVIARDRHADFVFALALATTAVESIAMLVRLGHQTEVGEIREGFVGGQKGSSAMPHKSNPATAEQLCGLARLARTFVPAALADVALWHERDLTHSSVERVVLPDLCALSHYVLRSATALVSNWSVDTARMSDNLSRTQDFVCSEALLHALIVAGLSRDAAYRTVQALVRDALGRGTTLLVEAQRQGTVLSEQDLKTALDPARLLAHAARAVDAL